MRLALSAGSAHGFASRSLEYTTPAYRCVLCVSAVFGRCERVPHFQIAASVNDNSKCSAAAHGSDSAAAAVDARTAFRILDASLNRVGEGLRTWEDFARFGLDHAGLCEGLKQVRHRLAVVAQRVPNRQRMLARDTPGDVGTVITTATEGTRQDPAAVARAAAVRCQQALRSAEEYSKCVVPEVAVELEALRYQCYTLAVETEQRVRSHPRLRGARLYVLIEAGDGVESLIARVAELAAAGVDALQLRDKRIDDATCYERALAVSRFLSEREAATRPLWIINDRADIAVAAGADGVHVGQEELPCRAARRIVGPGRLVGVSTHSLRQAQAAASEGADYIGCGPTFPSDTKPFDAFAGLDFLRQVAAELTLPAFAIGGIDTSNVDEVLGTGVHRIAVAGAVQSGADARGLRARLVTEVG